MVDLRIGQGIDIHPFGEGRKLMLGGVEIPHDQGLVGHSDADVLLHAITDALLGATGRGDIGTHFPDTDLEWKDADSRELLKSVWKEIAADGWRLINMDSTVLTELPKLKPYISAMEKSIGGCLGVQSDRISVKATTSERLGFVGRSEGILVHCVVLVERNW